METYVPHEPVSRADAHKMIVQTGLEVPECDLDQLAEALTNYRELVDRVRAIAERPSEPADELPESVFDPDWS